MRRHDKLAITIGGAIVAIVGLGYVIITWQPHSTVTSADTTHRQTYAALYQGAWRQDDGTQPTLVTATLLVPPAKALLGQDSARSSSEEQLWNIVKSTTDRQLAFVMTVDSVDRPVPDDIFLHNLSLQIAGGKPATFSSWTPIIAPSRIATPTNTTSSQMGIAIFSTPESLDWTTLGEITLHVNGISGERDRSFIWVKPGLLLEVQ